MTAAHSPLEPSLWDPQMNTDDSQMLTDGLEEDLEEISVLICVISVFICG
jgi:hypothetical protein